MGNHIVAHVTDHHQLWISTRVTYIAVIHRIINQKPLQRITYISRKDSVLLSLSFFINILYGMESLFAEWTCVRTCSAPVLYAFNAKLMSAWINRPCGFLLHFTLTYGAYFLQSLWFHRTDTLSIRLNNFLHSLQPSALIASWNSTTCSSLMLVITFLYLFSIYFRPCMQYILGRNHRRWYFKAIIEVLVIVGHLVLSPLLSIMLSLYLFTTLIAYLNSLSLFGIFKLLRLFSSCLLILTTLYSESIFSFFYRSTFVLSCLGLGWLRDERICNKSIC